ncbi:MAG TPA: FG-GAP-like repeat-containing protein, partial [Planctomycetota bacterium]|nr:FG-GAP-like repeat-containing protein [Planctomycetota bacterium]
MQLRSRTTPTCLLAAGGLLALAPAATAQLFAANTADIPTGSPGNNSTSENVDFGDVDLDGDWDAAFADGGDQGNDQNRLWVNQGGQQGGTVGVFVDATATQFPVWSDDSRDVEFVDFDADGDLDLYVSNTAAISNQGNRWWANTGGAQGGTLGFYADQTATRWVGLGGAGSSIPPALLTQGTFIDWSCDCDFGDLDDDGDIDLVHSTYGGAFGGNAPTRIFLNDGDGHFQEFNPSGFQLTGTTIANGMPALWAQGMQQANTTDGTGAFADIASSALDIDLADSDGDLDLDILHGARGEPPRFFRNLLEENGTLGFRDVTSIVFTHGYATGGGHYEQEMGDVDNDGDVDIYGLNWLATAGLSDVILDNDGNGVFGEQQILAGSGADDNEGDFVDVDGDGDVDLYVANFSGSDKVYVNTGLASGDFALLTLAESGTGGVTSASSLDADAADVDKDGDYDVFVAMDVFQPNVYMENVGGGPDVSAPYIPRVENDGDRVAAPGTFSVRAQVYDNAPYYITWYVDTELRVSVDGFALPALPMPSSQGQIFRAVVPANLVGPVSYTVHATDEYGNAGASAPEALVATTALAVGG